MKLAPCNKHKGEQNLICVKIRHDNGDEATQQEIYAEIYAQKHRADALAAIIRELCNVMTHDAETKDEFVARCRVILGANPDARLI